MKIHLTRTIFAPSLTKSLAAGQTDAVVSLGPGKLNDRSARRFHKILNADDLGWPEHDHLERLYRSGLRILGRRTGHPAGRLYAPSPHSGACSP